MRFLYFGLLKHQGDHAMSEGWRRRFGAVVGVSAMVLLYVLICSGQINTGGTKKEEETDSGYIMEQTVLPVTIAGGDASWETCVREIASMYMKEHPEIDVQVYATPTKENMDYAEALLVQEALGNCRGIVEMKNAQLYAEAGKLAELPDWLTEQMRSVNSWNGQVYSVSRYYTSRGVIYNMEIFRELGLEVPKTWEEFLQICRVLKENQVVPLTMGIQDLWHLNHWSNGLFINDVWQKAPNWLQECREGTVHWTDEEPRKMLSDFQKLFKEEYVESHFADRTDAETIELLTEGRAAMLYSVTSMFSQILRSDPDFEPGWFFLPNDLSEPVAGLDGSWEWTISASCKEEGNYDTALDFLQFYYREDVYRIVLQRMNGISSLKQEIIYDSVDIQKELLELIGEGAEIQEDFWTRPEVPEGFGSTLYQNMLLLAAEEQSVEETSEILEREWREGCGGR